MKELDVGERGDAATLISFFREVISYYRVSSLFGEGSIVRFGLCASHVLVLRQLGDWGYDYAEIGATALFPFEDEAVFAPRRAELQSCGISIEALAGFIPGSVPVIGPNVDWNQVQTYLETTIGRAVEVGVKAINWGSAVSRWVPDGWPMSRAWEQIERASELIARIAEKSDIVIAIEAVNPREANVLYYLTDALHLAKVVNRPNLRLNVDYYHVVKQNEPIEHVATVAEWLAHAHTSDDERRFPTLGDWDQRPFLRALRSAGYDGRLSFEVRDVGDGRYAERARTSVQQLRALQREVEAERP
jgi:sugar phosphate isomerase/epimerase